MAPVTAAANPSLVKSWSRTFCCQGEIFCGSFPQRKIRQSLSSLNSATCRCATPGSFEYLMVALRQGTAVSSRNSFEGLNLGSRIGIYMVRNNTVRDAVVIEHPA